MFEVEMGKNISRLVGASEHDLEKTQAVLSMMAAMKQVWEVEAERSRTMVGRTQWWGLETVIGHAVLADHPGTSAQLFLDHRSHRWLPRSARRHFRADVKIWIPQRGRHVLAEFFTKLAQIDRDRLSMAG